jgi:hypothetical protein
MSVVTKARRIYLTEILPRATTHARITFRNVRDPDRIEEMTQEMLAVLWKWTLGLVRRRKDPSTFPNTLVAFAARAIRAGRKLTGNESAQDVLSFVAQQRHGFTVASLPEIHSLYDNVIDEALHDNTQTPVADQVCFRLDFPRWLATYDQRRRSIALDMSMGEKTSILADRYGMTWGRISQMRREYHKSWKRFCGESA